MHPMDNTISYECQITEDYIDNLYNHGWEYIRRSPHIVPTLLVSELKKLRSNKNWVVQCPKCEAIELFVDYGSGYFKGLEE